MKAVLLGEVARIIQKRPCKLLERGARISGYPAYGAGGIVGRSSVHDYEGEAIVLSRSGTRCGKCYLAQGRWSALGGVHVILPDLRRVDVRYLWFQINRESGWLRAGSARSFIRHSEVRNRRVLLPELSEQRNIAATLEQAERRCGVYRHMIKLGAEILPQECTRLLHEATNRRKGIRLVDLGKYLDFVTSGHRRSAKHFSNKGHRFIRSCDVQNLHICDEHPVYVGGPLDKQMARAQTRLNDVLITITGSQVGRTAPVLAKHDKAFVSQHVAILRPKQRLLPAFLAAFLSMEKGGRQEVARLQYGQTRPALNLAQLKQIRIPMLSVPEQQRFSMLFQEYQRLRHCHHEALRQAEYFLATLLHHYFANA